MKNLSLVRILSRKSDLAIIQAKEVGMNLLKNDPNLKIEYLTKSTLGDKDLKTPLSEMIKEGVFTDDLREDLIKNKCDIVVHSWKDLPLDLGQKTIIAGTLSRADQRDIFFLKKNNISKIKKNKKISILSSSPRRIYNLESFIENYLPFQIKDINFVNIRGNIPTRLKKFINGSDDAFIVAKAALDRLLGNNLSEYKQLSEIIKKYIDKCLWTITPLSLNPTSPGQGAIACEIKTGDILTKNIIKKINNPNDYKCVEKERKILENYGGGCHQKIGVSYFKTQFGLMYSSKGEISEGNNFQFWEKEQSNNENYKKISLDEIFPKSIKDYNLFERNLIKESVKKINKIENHCIWISRNSSLPNFSKINESNIVWTSGTKTWKNLSKRGIWVNGTSDGIGEDFDTKIDSLTKKPWIKLTHNKAPISKIKKRISSYKLMKKPLKVDLSNKKYFYWMSSSAFKYVLEKNPNIINKFHSCGPGNTYKEIKKMLGEEGKLEIFISYDSWKKFILK